MGEDTDYTPEATPMLDHQELELKWALTATDHRRLLELLTASYRAPQLLAQENRFYDTADRRLRTQRMNIRIRQENERFILTCKQKSTATHTADGLSSHHEWEDALPANLVAGMAQPDAAWSAALPVPEPVRMALAGQPLQALGGFGNQRHEWRVARDGIEEVLCLDCTTIGERLDYELEIETSDPVVSAAYWRDCFGRWQIPVVVQPLTKFARYLALGSL